MDPVEQQVQAYNARDLDEFLAPYSTDIHIEDGRGNSLMTGIEAMRAFYGKLFSRSPD